MSFSRNFAALNSAVVKTALAKGKDIPPAIQQGLGFLADAMPAGAGIEIEVGGHFDKTTGSMSLKMRSLTIETEAGKADPEV